MYDVVETITSGLSSMRTWINTISSNIANAQTTRTAEGGPYKRKDVVITALDKTPEFASALDEQSLSKPRVLGVVEDQSAPRKVFEPGHPDADNDGYVSYPNINPVESMTNLMTASRAYEANMSALRTVRNLVEEALRFSRTA